MSEDRGQRARLVAMKRAFGMTPEARQQLERQLETLDDWRGTCQSCGLERQGTIASLRGACPRCGYEGPGGG